MTCVAALVHEGRVVMAADSAGVNGYDLTTRADPKVFRLGPRTDGPFLVGFTSSFRMGQIVQHHVDPPRPYDHPDLHALMVQQFIPAIREALTQHGYNKADNGRDEGGCMLVGVRGRLFCIEEDYQVGESVDGFEVIGCGRPYALGALAVTGGDPIRRVERAVRVAERFSAGVRGPVRSWVL